jgi:hypothetical protein
VVSALVRASKFAAGDPMTESNCTESGLQAMGEIAPETWRPRSSRQLRRDSSGDAPYRRPS